MNGHKVIENRQIKMAPGWYAVHVGAVAHCGIELELTFRKEFKMPSVMGMKNGHVSGVCKVETAVPHERVKKNRWAVADYKIANIITEVIPFDDGETVPARGNLGNWPLKDAQERVNALTKEAIALGHRKKTRAYEELADVLDAVGKEGETGKVKRPAKEAPKAQGEAGPPVKKAKREAVPSSEPAEAPEPVVKKPGDIRAFFK